MRPTNEVKAEIADKVQEVRTDAEIAGRVAAGFGHAVILAGLGAAGVVVDESEALAKRLVDRGVVAEQETRQGLGELRKRIRRPEALVVDPLQKVERRIDTVLDKMNVPSREDLKLLDTKIQTLAAKIDALLTSDAATKVKRSA